MPIDVDTDEQKRILKEAINEYIERQVAKVGWWAIKGLVGLALGGLLYLALIKLGMKPE